MTRGRVVAALGVLLMVASIAWCGYAFARDRHDAALADARRDALSTALVSVPELLTYKAATIDADFAKAYPLLTGPFKQQFTDLATRTIIPQARDGGVQTTAKVAASGTTTNDETSSDLLLFVDQTTTSKDSPETRVEGSRVRVTMRKADGVWKVAGMTPV